MENITVKCSLFPEFPERCDVIIAVRRASGAVSLAGCTFVIGLIWLFKKYTVFTQRIILYLSIAGFFVSVAYLMGEVMYEGSVCQFQAWFLQFCVFSLLLWVTCVTFDLFMNLVKKTSTEKFEIGYHFFSWGISLLLSLLPLTDDQYGPAEAWCWIKSNWGWRFGIFYLPLFTALAGMVIVYAYIVYSLKIDVRTWQRTYDPENERRKHILSNEIKPLIAYPLVYIAISVFPLINRIQTAVDPDHPVFVLVLLQALCSPIQGAVNAIVYGLDKETFRRLTATQIKMAVQRRFRRKPTIQEYRRNMDMEIIIEMDQCKINEQQQIAKIKVATIQNQIEITTTDQPNTLNQQEL